jgi:predicted transposase YbfD/YdcC
MFPSAGPGQPHLGFKQTLYFPEVVFYAGRMAWPDNRNRYRDGFPDCLDAFRQLPDPRHSPATRHYFGEILFIALAATVSGMDGFEDIAVFSREREDWLRGHLELPNGLPGADTYARVFAAIDPQAFLECFTALVASRCPALEGELVAIDGKTLRRSGTKGGRKALHVISAWAGSRGITLGQLAVGEKSNEITAVPKLLRQLDVKGCVVSLDAMGCQHRTTVAIAHAGADWLLALKGNQGTLHEGAVALFADEAALEWIVADGGTVARHEDTDGGHGRVEQRRLCVTDHLAWIDPKERRKWLGLRSVLCVESVRHLPGAAAVTARRYWLSSLPPDAPRLLELVRGHWAIENRCHWVMDVVFNEDQSRIRSGHAAKNMSLLRRLTHNLLQTSLELAGKSVRSKRLAAALNPKRLAAFLGLS